MGSGAVHPADKQLVDDVARIAESVREVVDARAAMISRVIDDEWLEVMTVVGEPSSGLVDGLRWRRSDLAGLLADAEHLGRLHATERRTLSYVEVPTNVPETALYVADHLGLLIAPLHAADGELLGVLSTEGPVDIAHPPAGTCELVELYAEQARLALTGLRRQDVLTERLRMSYAAQGVLQAAAAAETSPSLLESVAGGLGEMMRARCCLDLRGARAPVSTPRLRRTRGRSPSRLGADICTLVQPLVGTCLTDETTLTDESAPLLGRIAGPLTSTSRRCSRRSASGTGSPRRLAGAP